MGLLSNLSSWWARRLAVIALCTHFREHGDKWHLKRRYGAIDPNVWTFGDLTVHIWHSSSYGEEDMKRKVAVNGVPMSFFAACKIRKAIKQRGTGMRVYRDIVTALKPANTPLQIEMSKCPSCIGSCEATCDWNAR